MSNIRCIGISTGGGDAPGLNAVIRAAVRTAHIKYGWKVMGIPDGFDGLIWPERAFELTDHHVSGLISRGGTILGTTNRGNPFRHSVTEDGKEVIRDRSAEVVRNAVALGIDAVIVIGGDGSQAIGLELFRKGMHVVGVPKTIDNDLSATDVTFGFDTALQTATEALDKIKDTAQSHHRVMIMEVMGRDAGWIALNAGIAGGAHAILIPEIPFTVDRIAEFIHEREVRGKRFTLIVVAEGVPLDEELASLSRSKSPGIAIMNALDARTHKECRVTVLGHVQRGGSPSAFDRVLATRFGSAAVDLIAKGKFGKMVCLRGTEVQSVDVSEAIGHLKTVDPDGQLVNVARSIGVCFGDAQLRP